MQAKYCYKKRLNNTSKIKRTYKGSGVAGENKNQKLCADVETQKRTMAGAQLEKRFEIGRKIFMNVKDNRKEIDRHKCLERWDQFIRLHDEEIKRLHLHPCVVSSMGI
ncbi:hypothetical protein [Anoxybacillus kestanbolensis]|uniref:hypothetical protein n=1 Tax=Anoxybacillus kestanbolensis TaxID=227476 RepID=UPI003D20D06F